MDTLTYSQQVNFPLNKKELERSEKPLYKKKRSIQIKDLSKKDYIILQKEIPNILGNLEGFLSETAVLNSVQNSLEGGDIFGSLSKFDLTSLFGNIRKNEFFDCMLFTGNVAWISESENGHVRYFTKRFGSKAIGLDLIDVASIYYRENNRNTIKVLKSILGINKISYEEKLNQQNIKYRQNKKLLSDILNIKQEYPELYPHLKSCKDVLLELNEVGERRILIDGKSMKEVQEAEHIFFVSASFIADKLNCQRTGVVRKINLLSTLGLIKKIGKKDIPKRYLKKSEKLAEENTAKTLIGYYYISDIEHTLKEAERKAEILNRNKINSSNITKNKVELAFGSVFASLAFTSEAPQKAKKNRKTQRTKTQDLWSKMEKFSLKLLDEKDFLTKQEIIKEKIGRFTQKEKTSCLEMNLIEFLENNNLEYKRPTKKEKEVYCLTGNDFIIKRKKEKRSGK